MRSRADSPSPAGGFPEDAFADLAAIEPGHFWFESRNRLIVWALRRYFPDARTLLEVGCGTGFVLQALHREFPALVLTGTDALPGGLAIAASRVPSATLRQEDARHLESREAFDVVCAFDVLEHIPEDAAAISRLVRAAKPGGGILITVPQHPALWSHADDVGHHVRRYRRRELVTRLTEAGAKVARITSFVSVLLPLLAASRWWERCATGPITNRELRPASLVNSALRIALSAERSSIKAGLSWPCGGSLLAVARAPGPDTRAAHPW